MKILEIHIQNIRGIHDLSLKPDGKNFAIWGPNGSGKSAVVDAVDFLLTGRISRLMGKGTGGITIGKYGPHIDKRPEDAIVQAKILLPGYDEPINIERWMSNPSMLICDKDKRGILEPFLIVARRGQHVLTRREILKYITSDASTCPRNSRTPQYY